MANILDRYSKDYRERYGTQLVPDRTSQAYSPIFQVVPSKLVDLTNAARTPQKNSLKDYSSDYSGRYVQPRMSSPIEDSNMKTDKITFKPDILSSGLKDRASHASLILNSGLENNTDYPRLANYKSPGIGIRNVAINTISDQPFSIENIPGISYDKKTGGYILPKQSDESLMATLNSLENSGYSFNTASKDDGSTFLELLNPGSTGGTGTISLGPAPSGYLQTVSSGSPVLGRSIPTSGLLMAKNSVDVNSPDYVPDRTVILGGKMTTTDYGAGLAYDQNGNLVPGMSQDRVREFVSGNKLISDSDQLAREPYLRGQEFTREKSLQELKNLGQLQAVKASVNNKIPQAQKRFSDVRYDDLGNTKDYDVLTGESRTNGIYDKFRRPTIDIAENNPELSAQNLSNLNKTNPEIADQILNEIAQQDIKVFQKIMDILKRFK